MPKDEPNLIEGALGVGHRYDWENAMIVLSEESSNATLVGMAASFHGDYVACSGSACDKYLDGNSPLIRYYTADVILDHSLGFTSTVGGTQPLIAWDELPAVAQEALTDKDWGGKSFQGCGQDLPDTFANFIGLQLLQSPSLMVTLQNI